MESTPGKSPEPIIASQLGKKPDLVISDVDDESVEGAESLSNDSVLNLSPV